MLERALEWNPDLVVIASPTHFHAEQALATARYGCPLFIEKPLSHSLEGLDILCAEVDRRNLVTMVGCNMRFHPGPAMVKRLIGEGAIGKIIAARIQTGSYLPRWRPSQDYRNSYSASSKWGGVILDCIHEIDLALWYFGPASVVAAARLPATTIGLEIDGLAEIILNHKSSVLSNLHLNFVQRDYRRACQVIGSEGTIYWDFGHRQVEVFGPDGELRESFLEPRGWQVNQMYVDELDHFLRAVQSGRPTCNPVSQGLVALQLAITAKTMPSRGVHENSGHHTGTHGVHASSR